MKQKLTFTHKEGGGGGLEGGLDGGQIRLRNTWAAPWKKKY